MLCASERLSIKIGYLSSLQEEWNQPMKIWAHAAVIDNFCEN